MTMNFGNISYELTNHPSVTFSNELTRDVTRTGLPWTNQYFSGTLAGENFEWNERHKTGAATLPPARAPQKISASQELSIIDNY